MTTLQRFALYLAMRARVLPRVDVELVERAVKAVREAELKHKRESGEFRRHVALRSLVDGGAGARAAGVAIEVAITIGAASSGKAAA